MFADGIKLIYWLLTWGLICLCVVPFFNIIIYLLLVSEIDSLAFSFDRSEKYEKVCAKFVLIFDMWNVLHSKHSRRR